jgi:hypothetical protein
MCGTLQEHHRRPLARFPRPTAKPSDALPTQFSAAPGTMRRIGRCFLLGPLTRVLHRRELHPEAAGFYLT